MPAQTHVLLISRGGSLAVSLCEAYSLQISRERVCKPCTLFKYDIDKIGSCASKKSGHGGSHIETIDDKPYAVA